jgi:hypothetical protein
MSPTVEFTASAPPPRSSSSGLYSVAFLFGWTLVKPVPSPSLSAIVPGAGAANSNWTLGAAIAEAGPPISAAAAVAASVQSTRFLVGSLVLVAMSMGLSKGGGCGPAN